MKDVINPPSIAIALHYDKKSAPRVTAKGKGHVAEQILKIAEEHDIPLQPDPALARLLGTIPLGSEIPPELYKAVAEVIAFAYLLSGRSA
jgi:flagellar biosynthesis protein